MIDREMKKRLILGFVCAVLLFIVMTSNDGTTTIVEKVKSFIDASDSNDVSCYEIAISDGFPHFESDSENIMTDKNIFFSRNVLFR